MDDGLGKIKIFTDYFEDSTPGKVCLPSPSSASSEATDSPVRSRGRLWARRKLRSATSMLKLISQPRLRRGSSSGNEKVELTAAELESLHSNIVDVDQREAYLRAQLEHLDELLRSAHFFGYLYIRTRWTALPGEPPIDDGDVDDWLPRFVVLHGSCIFFHFRSADIGPQDSTLLSDIVELGSLPTFLQDQQTCYSFYILTRQGLRFECSSLSKVQVDSWLAALSTGCNLDLKPLANSPRRNWGGL